MKFRIFPSILFLFFADCATVGKLLQVPDKDPTLRTLVDKIGLPEANAKIRDSVFWVLATTQFSARRITVISEGKPYSTWMFDMLLQKSDCNSKTTSISDISSCRAISASPKLLCNVNLSLFDGNYSTVESEVYCTRA